MNHHKIPKIIIKAMATMAEPYDPSLTVEKLERVLSFQPEKNGLSEQLLSRKEAAEALHISMPTIDRMLVDQEIGRVTVRGRVFIRQREVQRIISGSNAIEGGLN